MKGKKEILVGYPEYRCERCGLIHTRFLMTLEDFCRGVDNIDNSYWRATPEERREHMYRINALVSSEINEFFFEPIHIYSVHVCADDGRGLSKLIGLNPFLAYKKGRKFFSLDGVELPYFKGE